MGVALGALVALANNALVASGTGKCGIVALLVHVRVVVVLAFHANIVISAIIAVVTGTILAYATLVTIE